MFELQVAEQTVRLTPSRAINAGYSGRDRDAVEDHIEELVAEGIPEPDQVPTQYPVAPYTVLVDPGVVQVVGEHTSGEAEFGLVLHGDDTYVVAASDHTDRALEVDSIQKSKQIAPNVLSHEAWRFGSVREHWDRIELRAWSTNGGTRKLYQNATLGDILTPATLVDELGIEETDREAVTVLLSGTVPTVSGELTPGSRFEVELHDPVLDRTIEFGYDVTIL